MAYLGISTTEDLLKAVLNETYRIREFHCQPDDFLVLQTSFLDLLKDCRMPTLESLIISGARDLGNGWGLVTNPSAFASSLPPMFDGGTMPKLKRLCLMSFSSWPSGYFTSLTHICLHDQMGAVDMSEFLDFLELSPLLQELILVCWGPMTPAIEISSVPPSRLLSLSHL